MNEISLGLVLIVEDDRKTASLISLYLEREGYKTVAAYDGEAALALAAAKSPVFVILDLMLPKVDGWEVCRQIRRVSDVPILMLTAKGDEVDRVSGFVAGADDYLVKPFSPRELVARVKAILRRTTPRDKGNPAVVSWGGLTLDVEKHRLTVEERQVSLTPSEFKLLQILISSPGRVFTRDQLLEILYPSGEEVIDRVVDVHIGKLRQKIEKDAAAPRYILTVRGFGYQFSEDLAP